MLRTAALLLAPLLFAAAPVAAQTARTTGHAEFKRVLESVRAPAFSAGKPIPGVTSTYAVQGSGCRSDVQVFVPPSVVGGVSHPANIEKAAIDWSTTSEVTTWTSYILIKGPGLPAEGRFFYAGSEAAALALRDHLRNIATACGGKTGPEPAPLPPRDEFAEANAAIVAILGSHVEGMETAYGYIPDLMTFRVTSADCTTKIERYQRRISSGNRFIREETRTWTIYWPSVIAVHRTTITNARNNPNGVNVMIGWSQNFLVGMNSERDRNRLINAMETVRLICG